MIVKEVIKMQFIEKLEIDKVKLWDKNPRINDEASEKLVDVIIKRYIDYKKSAEDVFVIREGEKFSYYEIAQ